MPTATMREVDYKPDESRAKDAVSYRSNSTRNKETHKRIQREMDMFDWSSMRMDVEKTYSDGRVKLIGEYLSPLLVNELQDMGYEFKNSKVRTVNYQLMHRAVFEKEEDTWR